MTGKRQMSLFSVLKQLLPFAALAMLFAAVGIMHVTSRVMVVDAGYRLSKLEGDGRDLTLENQRLKLELATLKSPSRLEKIAREQLHMSPPPPGGVIAARMPEPSVHPERSSAGAESKAQHTSTIVLGAVSPGPEGALGNPGPSTALRSAQGEREE